LASVRRRLASVIASENEVYREQSDRQVLKFEHLPKSRIVRTVDNRQQRTIQRIRRHFTETGFLNQTASLDQMPRPRRHLRLLGFHSEEVAERRRRFSALTENPPAAELRRSAILQLCKRRRGSFGELLRPRLDCRDAPPDPDDPRRNASLPGNCCKSKTPWLAVTKRPARRPER
jgi:hypothetical protein